MNIRDILLYVDAAPGPGVLAALALAQQHQAHLTALHVIDMPTAAVELEGGARVIEIQREAYEAAAQAAHKKTMDMARGAGIELEWRVDEGRTATRVGGHALACDLVVVGVASAERKGHFDHIMAEDLILECGKPVLTVPESYSGDPIGRFATIAWNSTRESARAVSDALPLLRKCERVSVVTVDAADLVYQVGEVPGADICRFLARHGVDAQAQTTDSGNKSTGEAIIEWAKGQGADLIVMGAYGHWRLRELVLGGATRDVLRNSAVPLLMSR